MALMFSTKNKRFRLTHPSWIEEYKHLCAGYEKNCSMYITLREELQHEESEVLSLLVLYENRKRSIGSFFRGILDIAHPKKQK